MLGRTRDDEDDAVIPDDVQEELAEDMREVQALRKDIEELEEEAEILEAERERRRRIFAGEDAERDVEPGPAERDA